MKKINWSDEVKSSIIKIVHSELRELKNPAINSDMLIHNSRKRVKNLRAILKLIEKNIGTKIYKDINSSLRSLNRVSANIRRAYVMIGILDRESKTLTDSNSIKLLESLKTTIEESMIAAQSKITTNQILTSYFDYFHSFEKKVENWKFDTKNFSLIKNGLLRIYDQGKSYSKLIKQRNDVPVFHELRKSSKDLSYALDILQKAWPDVIKSYNTQIKLLNDYLGDMHDLYEFKLFLNKNLNEKNMIDQKIIFLNNVDKRINSFIPITVRLGEKIFAERTESFIYRIGRLAQYKLVSAGMPILP